MKFTNAQLALQLAVKMKVAKITSDTTEEVASRLLKWLKKNEK